MDICTAGVCAHIGSWDFLDERTFARGEKRRGLADCFAESIGYCDMYRLAIVGGVSRRQLMAGCTTCFTQVTVINGVFFPNAIRYPAPVMRMRAGVKLIFPLLSFAVGG